MFSNRHISMNVLLLTMRIIKQIILRPIHIPCNIKYLMGRKRKIIYWVETYNALQFTDQGEFKHQRLGNNCKIIYIIDTWHVMAHWLHMEYFCCLLLRYMLFWWLYPVVELSLNLTRYNTNIFNYFQIFSIVVSRGAVRSAASSYAAMRMVAGSRPDLVITWEWHTGLALLCGCLGALEYPTTNSCGPINKSLSLSLCIASHTQLPIQDLIYSHFELETSCSFHFYISVGSEWI